MKKWVKSEDLDEVIKLDDLIVYSLDYKKPVSLFVPQEDWDLYAALKAKRDLGLYGDRAFGWAGSKVRDIVERSNSFALWRLVEEELPAPDDADADYRFNHRLVAHEGVFKPLPEFPGYVAIGADERVESGDWCVQPYGAGLQNRPGHPNPIRDRAVVGKVVRDAIRVHNSYWVYRAAPKVRRLIDGIEEDVPDHDGYITLPADAQLQEGDMCGQNSPSIKLSEDNYNHWKNKTTLDLSKRNTGCWVWRPVANVGAVPNAAKAKAPCPPRRILTGNPHFAKESPIP